MVSSSPQPPASSSPQKGFKVLRIRTIQKCNYTCKKNKVPPKTNSPMFTFKIQQPNGKQGYGKKSNFTFQTPFHPLCPPYLHPLIFHILITVLLSRNARAMESFCDDGIGIYSAMPDVSLSLANYEYPLWRDGDEMDASIAVPDHCMRLTQSDNYKNLLYGSLEHGDFATNFCSRRCEHYVQARTVNCAIRRSTLDWNVGLVSDPWPTDQLNCSDWNIPLTEKGKIDGISLKFAVFLDKDAFFNRPQTLDNASLAHLSSFPIRFLMMAGYSEQKSDKGHLVVEQLKEFIDKNPEITQVVLGSYGERLSLTNFNGILKTLPKLEALSYFNVDSKEINEQPHDDLSNLRALTFSSVSGIEGIPKWVQEATNLQMLQIASFLDDSYDLSVLDNLPQLEHFFLDWTGLTKIKAPFLAKSKKLISLEIRMNQISSIEEGAFDHMTELRYISLAGNNLPTIPQNLLKPLPNLINIDLKGCVETKLIGFDKSTYSGCPSQAKSLTVLPEIQNPENVMTLELSGMTQLAKNVTQLAEYLMQFKNLEILNIAGIGITTLDGLKLHKLCNLRVLNIGSNSFTGNDWYPEEIHLYLRLEQMHVDNCKIDKLPTPFIATVRTSPAMLYDIPMELAYSEAKAWADTCQKETMMAMTMFNYVTEDKKCVSKIDAVRKEILELDMKRWETTCA